MAQKVYLSKTMSGIEGLFTNNMLVMPLSEQMRNQSHEALAKYAERLGFELVTKEERSCLYSR